MVLVECLRTTTSLTAVSGPGVQTRTDNACIRLSAEWFRSRHEARVIIEAWRRHYNQIRPHSSLGYRTPAEFPHHHATTHPGATSFK